MFATCMFGSKIRPRLSRTGSYSRGKIAQLIVTPLLPTHLSGHVTARGEAVAELLTQSYHYDPYAAR